MILIVGWMFPPVSKVLFHCSFFNSWGHLWTIAHVLTPQIILINPSRLFLSWVRVRLIQVTSLNGVMWFCSLCGILHAFSPTELWNLILDNPDFDFFFLLNAMFVQLCETHCECWQQMMKLDATFVKWMGGWNWFNSASKIISHQPGSLCYLPNLCIVYNSSRQLNLDMGLCFLVLFIGKHGFVGVMGLP